MIPPRHIVLLNVFFTPHRFGGATIVADGVARALVQDHGIQVSAISVMMRSDLPPYSVMRSDANGITSWLINLPSDRSYTEIYDNPAVTQIVATLLTRLDPDLVHAHCLQDMGAGLLPMIRARGLPLVLSVHDFWWLCERQFMVKSDLTYCTQDPIRIEACAGCVPNLDRARTRFEALTKAAACADLITFPSHFAHQFCAASGLTAKRLAVWKNGVRGPGPDFFVAQTARRTRDSQLAFGYAGGATPIKGWPLIKAAFKGLERSNFKGLLVTSDHGKNEWQGQNIDSMQGNWQFYPRFEPDQMDAFYAQIDVLLFPSQWRETFGLLVREAAARGIHIIQTDCGGASEWDGADPANMLQIGQGPEPLRARIRDLLENRPPWPDPHPMPSAADQAREFLDLLGPIPR